MGTPFHLPVLCLVLLTLGHVMSFSIRHRPERSVDLADALAILQRQRRRVNVDFLPSQGQMMDDEPLTLRDVRDWLNGANGRSLGKYIEDERIPPSWLAGLADLEDFDPSDLVYNDEDMTVPAYPTSPVKASPREIEAIFETESNRDRSHQMNNQPSPALSKKTKEEMINVKGDRSVLDRAASSPKTATTIKSASSKRRVSSNDGLALSSLTKEEMKILMKAVGKLQQQFGEGEDDADDNDSSKGEDDLAAAVLDASQRVDIGVAPEPLREEVFVVSEPASEEELKSVFDETEGPVVKETKIVLAKGPQDKEPTFLEEQIISEKLPNGVGDEDEEEEEEENQNEADVESDLTKALTDELANELEAEQQQSDQEVAEKAVAEVEAAAEAAAVAEMENDSRGRLEEEDVLEDEDDDDLNAQKLATKYWLLNTNNNNNNKRFFRAAEQNPRRTHKRASGVFEDNFNSVAPNRKRKLALSVGHMGGGNGNGNGQGGRIDLSWLSPQLQAFVLKITSLQDEVDRLKMKSRLEDMENDALTDALNEATKAQSEGTVSDVEWSSLQQAIQLEAAVQDIKNSKPASQLADDDIDDDDDDVPWESDVIADKNDLVEDMFKRGDAFPHRDVIQTEDDDVIDGMPDSDFSLDVYNDRDNAMRGDDVEKLLEQSYFLKAKAVDPGDFEDDTAGVASLFMTNADRCPAVLKYSSNCALADVYSMPVDFEARALCNLHEMCYTCGRSLGVEQSQCDLVYRTAASTLCKKKDECEAESEIFLRAMKLKTRYISHTQPTCRSRCVAEFLGMI